MAYPTLLWFAGYSNMSSVVIVVICFIIMAIFITLVSMNSDISRPVQPMNGVEQRNMVKVVNPYFLQLEQQGKSLNEGLKIHLSRLCSCKAVVLWGVKISAFHDAILQTGHEIRRKLLSEDLLESLDLDPLHKESFQFCSPGDNTIFLPCPSLVSSAALGNIPRQRYPVTVFIFVPESPERTCPVEEGDSECSNNIVGLISVIHLKDEIVTQSSHVIQQYIKTAGVPIYSLQPLFVNSPSEEHCPERGHIPCDEESQDASGAHVRPQCSNSNQRQTAAREDISVSDTRCENSRHSSHYNVLQGGDTSEKHSSCHNIPSAGCNSAARVSDVSDLASSSEEGQLPSEAESSNTGVRRRRQPCCSHPQPDGESSPAMGLQTGGKAGHQCPESKRQSSSEKFRSAECVVCHTRKVMCVLLPCRHTCVCFGCFKLLDRCPMCRGSIESYFMLSKDEGDDTGSSDEDGSENGEAIHEIEQHAVNANFAEMWERFNMRLNTLLGFR